MRPPFEGNYSDIFACTFSVCVANYTGSTFDSFRPHVHQLHCDRRLIKSIFLAPIYYPLSASVSASETSLPKVVVVFFSSTACFRRLARDWGTPALAGGWVTSVPATPMRLDAVTSPRFP